MLPIIEQRLEKDAIRSCDQPDFQMAAEINPALSGIWLRV
jgi:hypothetical protein